MFGLDHWGLCHQLLPNFRVLLCAPLGCMASIIGIVRRQDIVGSWDKRGVLLALALQLGNHCTVKIVTARIGIIVKGVVGIDPKVYHS